MADKHDTLAEALKETTPVSEGRSVATRGGDLSGFPHRRDLAEHPPRALIGTRADITLGVCDPKFARVDRSRLSVLDLHESIERARVLCGPILQHEPFDHLKHVSDLPLVDRLGVHVVVQAVTEIAALPLRNFHLLPPSRGTLTEGIFA
jgi:hypothetical protein